MRRTLPAFLALAASAALADEPRSVSKPDAFKALVNPNCSHCVDEAKRRAADLRDDDPVLCWTRGYSDGGAIPIRFFLAPYRVISDSYGVFVYDPDAGFARGFEPAFTFSFHGWRNGIMTIRDGRDGTVYSALSGVGVEGPKKGQRLKPVPTLVATWDGWMSRYPNAVAYHMFEKYRPVELPKTENPDSVRTRPAKTDPRLKPDELVLGVRIGEKTKAFPLAKLAVNLVVHDKLGGEEFVVAHGGGLFEVPAAYRPVASPPRKFKAPNPDKDGVSPPDPGIPLAGKELPPVRLKSLDDQNGFLWDEGTDTLWDAAGRCWAGKLKGWTLDPVDCVVCKWFAWAAEYPETEVYGEPPAAKPGPKKEDPAKEIAGAAEFLRLLPKPFATLQAVDPKARTVTLLIEGETVAKVWPVEPDAEVKVRGWWGRLEQLTPGDRVWVWLKLNRHKQPVSVCMIADEMSQQDIHGNPPVVLRMDGDKITFTAKKRPERTLDAGKAAIDLGLNRKAKADDLELAQIVFVQSAGGAAREIFTPDVFDRLRGEQMAWLRKRWAEEGLPGTVSVNHVFGGELEVLIDHEGMRRARWLKAGDTVTLAADPPIKAVVKNATPWRERTQLRLVVGELAAADLKPGERVFVKAAAPPADVEDGPYPPDIDRPRTREQRIEWFLASVYCTCQVRGDICTGHFYTLASCNVNGCAAPNQFRRQVGERIDKGLTDRQIWDELLKAHGPLMARPHLLP